MFVGLIHIVSMQFIHSHSFIVLHIKTLLLMNIWVVSHLGILQKALPKTFLYVSFVDHLCTFFWAQTWGQNCWVIKDMHLKCFLKGLSMM